MKSNFIYKEIMPFGKYKGEQLVKVGSDRSYCEWLIPRMEVSELRNKLLAVTVCIYCKLMNGYTMFTSEEYEAADSYYHSYYENLGKVKFEEKGKYSTSYLRIEGKDPLWGERGEK